MLLKPKSILTIEISPWRVNIIEGVRSARQPKVLNYIQIPDPPQTHELLARKIAAALKEKGIKTKAAQLAFYHPQLEQRYFQIPSLSRQELRQVIKREVDKVKKRLRGELPQDSPENDKKSYELYYDYQLLEEIEANKAKKKGLLLTTVPKKLVDDYSRLLEKAELEPRLITSLPLAIANAMALVSQPTKDAKENQDNIGFLYLMPDKGLLVIVSQGSWRFSREISLQTIGINGQKTKAPTASTAGIDYKKLSLELSRSFIYFNQQERGKQVSSLILSSAQHISQNVSKYFEESLQVPVGLFDPTGKLNLGSIPEPTTGWPQLLNSFPVPLGLLTDLIPQASANLLPLKVRDHKKQLAGSLLISLILITYSLAVGAGYVGLRWAQETYRQAVEIRQQSVNQLRPVFEQCQKIEQERRRRDFQLAVFKQFERTSPLWRGVFYELSRLSPKGMIFSSMEITEGKKGWKLQAKVVIDAGTSMQAQQTINKFLVRLKDSVFFSRQRVLDVNIAPYKSTEQANKATNPALLQSQMNLSLSCDILY